MAGAGVIEGYLAELDGSLRGAARHKADLLAEARDGLVDAAERYRKAGLAEADAERRAVAEFGTVPEVRLGYQAELGLATGVRAARSLALALPLMHVLWELTLLVSFGGWSKTGLVMPSWYLVLAWVGDHLGFALGGLGVLTLLAVRLWCRRGQAVRAGRFAAALVTFAVTVDLLVRLVQTVTSGLINLRLLLISWPCALVGLMAVLVSLRLAVLARRAWSTCPASTA